MFPKLGKKEVLLKKTSLAGIYIHIPFCKKACVYCDFHFSTSMKNKTELIGCINKELKEKKQYLNTNSIQTIYFGGGTPSVLNQEELTSILSTIKKEYKVDDSAEITLEANPDDLTPEKLAIIWGSGVNRLSIGIQSFIARDLAFMNRSHTILQATNAIRYAKEIGFNNITIDLIYGIPNLTDIEWKRNIKKALELDVNHISAYCLTSEERTAMHHDIAKGKYELPSEDITSQQFKTLVSTLEENGYEQYEISNFSKKGHNSRHNSSYWKQTHFLGVGPSAHSFNGKTRRWNVSNNARYIKGANEDNWIADEEVLDEQTRYNEYVMTSLRTSWGIDSLFIKSNFSSRFMAHFTKESKRFILDNSLIQRGNTFTLSQSGKLLADRIASELFWVD
ncbi:MAG: radical SAM family heme chaperone HemW [Flavobacteriales bacterium]